MSVACLFNLTAPAVNHSFHITLPMPTSTDAVLHHISVCTNTLVLAQHTHDESIATGGLLSRVYSWSSCVCPQNSFWITVAGFSQAIYALPVAPHQQHQSIKTSTRQLCDLNENINTDTKYT